MNPGISQGGVPEWPKGADCKSAASRFEGSNPSPSTRVPIINLCGCSSAGRALAFQARRRGFESLRPLSVKQQSKYLLCFLKSRRILPVQRISRNFAHVAQLVERVLGKDEVSSSILDMGSLV